MSIAATVNQTIEGFQLGRIFGYRDLPAYSNAPSAVAQAIVRLADAEKVKRLAKGRYYVPKQGMFGELKPTDRELIRDVLYRDGKLRGYVTGVALYNRMGLTTQVPKTVTVAINGGRQEKDFGTIRIKSITSRAPVRKTDVLLLEYLDVLRDAKKIPDADPQTAIEMIANRTATLTDKEVKRLQKLAVEYYNAATRALLGLILTRNNQPIEKKLRQSLNPLTRFEYALDPQLWPNKRNWYIS